MRDNFIKFTIGTNVYKTPLPIGFMIEFHIKGPGGAKAFIYNPAPDIIAAIQPQGGKNQQITIEAGTMIDNGICMIGEIYAFKVMTRGIDRVLEMKILDSTAAWAALSICRTWQKNVKASKIIGELAKAFGIPTGKIALGIDKSYTAGLTFNTKLHKALEQMARDTGCDFFLRNNRLYFLPVKDKGLKTGVKITPATGLVGRLEKSVKGWKLKSLLDYRIGAGECISIESDVYKGDCKVICGLHFSSLKNAYTEMEVI